MGKVLTGVALFSGGLDSLLASRLILDQGCRVEALCFKTPFFEEKGAQGMPFFPCSSDIRFTTIDITERFLPLLSAPRYGYGRCLNPCIDCKILMLSESRAFMEGIGGDFVFTGEVLGQRPMSQRRDTLRLLEQRAGLGGVLLRPLSARLLPPTRMEEQGLLDRERFLDLSGRSRKRQIAMASQLGWTGYPTPGGGCLLTDSSFARKLKCLLGTGALTPDMIRWIKVGRQFLLPPDVRLIVGRNHPENQAIFSMAGEDTIILRPAAIPGPVGVLLKDALDETKRLAASIVAGYSDTKDGGVVAIAIFKGSTPVGEIPSVPLPRQEINRYRFEDTRP